MTDIPQGIDNPLPEPTPMEMFPSIRRLRTEFFNTFPTFPSEAIITGAGGIIGEQSIRFNEQDIQEEIQKGRELYQEDKPFPQFLSELADYVSNRFIGNPQKWKTQFLDKGIDINTTLDTVRSEEAASCFHRSIVYSHILQRLGIEAKAIQGDWIETTRNNVKGTYEGKTIPRYSKIGATSIRYFEGEQGDYHAFTLVRRDGQFFLVDPALRMPGETPYHIVIPASMEDLVKGDIAVPLPNGKKRHYVFKNEGFEYGSFAPPEEERNLSEAGTDLDVFIRRKVLFHGSATPGIDKFITAENVTVGSGVYLTSDEGDAIGYANERADRQSEPIVYKVEIENLRLANLTTDENVKKIIDGYKLVLQQKEKNSDNWLSEVIFRRALEAISNGQVRSGTVANATHGNAQLFTEYLSSLGYDGLIALEGGEGKVGDHDSYVVFNPEKVKIVQEQKVAV